MKSLDEQGLTLMAIAKQFERSVKTGGSDTLKSRTALMRYCYKESLRYLLYIACISVYNRNALQTTVERSA